MSGYNTAPVETELVIDGEWRPASSGDRYQIFNPARPSELVGTAAAATTEDVDAAVRAAHGAFPAWAALSYHERAAYLRKINEAVVADEAELKDRIRLFTREHGKIIKEATLELTRLGLRFDLVASYADRLATDEELAGPPFDTIITRQPRGVAALVVPWNWPLSILGAKLPQALMAGNTVVIKPSSHAALAPMITLRKMAEVLPPGVVNVVTGPASRIGDPLLTHPLVRKINFTGGIETGKHVMRIAADNLTPVTLELGGNDAAIVLEDATLDDEAFLKMYLGTFMSTGQICMAAKRLYAHESRFDEVVDGFSAFMARQRVGDGTQPDVTMGPVNNVEQYENVTDFIDEAKHAGADVRELGTVDDESDFDAGYFIKPTMVVRPDPGLKIVKDEQFGPAIPILQFGDDEEAIDLANDSEYGLCSSVWTDDRDRAVAVARRLEAGYTYLNAHGPAAQDSRAPFGGFKSSGLGRNLGYEGVLEFQEWHSISSQPGWLLGG
ncbi:MAG: aldehyde dehydrogenase family protein [Acidimicrobiia bacterium]